MLAFLKTLATRGLLPTTEATPKASSHHGDGQSPRGHGRGERLGMFLGQQHRWGQNSQAFCRISGSSWSW